MESNSSSSSIERSHVTSTSNAPPSSQTETSVSPLKIPEGNNTGTEIIYRILLRRSLHGAHKLIGWNESQFINISITKLPSSAEQFSLLGSSLSDARGTIMVYEPIACGYVDRGHTPRWENAVVSPTYLNGVAQKGLE